MPAEGTPTFTGRVARLESCGEILPSKRVSKAGDLLAIPGDVVPSRGYLR